MKKNKLYILLSIITLICLFGTAAICNQCAAGTVEEVEGTEEEAEAAADETVEEEELAEGDKASEEEEETPGQEEQKEAPTITLEIYEGPIYSSSDNVCYYRIKANVTGTPTPDVEFSKDDSNGYWGEYKAQVNLNDPSETYTLTATATNSEGSATDSIALSWGCPITNNPPEISDLFISPGTKFTGSTIDVRVTAADPDGDSLNYNWSADGGSFDSTTIPNTEWKAPSTAGNYNITVVVDDGKGGQDQKTETVAVLIYQSSISLPKIPGGGYIEEGLIAVVCIAAWVGDSQFNRPYRGFLSFDISSLAGKVVVAAEMEFEPVYITNDPYSLIEKIWVDAVYWGTDDIILGDYDLPGVLLGEYDIPIFTCSSIELKDALNQAINDGHDRFQIRLRHKGFQSNQNWTMDALNYGVTAVKFIVTYLP